MGWIGKCTMSALVFVTLGCTKGTPDFGDMGSDNLPQPLFLGKTSESLSTNNPTQTFSIVGQCDQKIQDLVAVAVGTASAASTLPQMSASAISVNCETTGQFSFTLKSLTDLGYTPQDGHTYDIQLRGVTKGGISNPSVIHIVFTNTGAPDPKHILITSGGTESQTGAGERIATSTNFKAQIRVGGKLNVYSDATVQDAMTVKSGTTFKMLSGIGAQNN